MELLYGEAVITGSNHIQGLTQAMGYFMLLLIALFSLPGEYYSGMETSQI